MSRLICPHCLIEVEAKGHEVRDPFRCPLCNRPIPAETDRGEAPTGADDADDAGLIAERAKETPSRPITRPVRGVEVDTALRGRRVLAKVTLVLAIVACLQAAYQVWRTSGSAYEALDQFGNVVRRTSEWRSPCTVFELADDIDKIMLFGVIPTVLAFGAAGVTWLQCARSLKPFLISVVALGLSLAGLLTAWGKLRAGMTLLDRHPQVSHSGGDGLPWSVYCLLFVFFLAGALFSLILGWSLRRSLRQLGDDSLGDKDGNPGKAAAEALSRLEGARQEDPGSPGGNPSS